MKPTISLPHDESKTIAFRVSPEDYARITMLIETSGYTRQDYLRERAMQHEITVHPNCRVKILLEKYLIEICGELKRIRSCSEDENAILKLDRLLDIISQL